MDIVTIVAPAFGGQFGGVQATQVAVATLHVVWPEHVIAFWFGGSAHVPAVVQILLHGFPAVLHCASVVHATQFPLTQVFPDEQSVVKVH